MAKKGERSCCQKQRYFQSTLHHGQTKHTILYSVMNEVLQKVDFKTTTQNAVGTMLQQAFQARDITCMVPFEVDKEMGRMAFLLNRYLRYEHFEPHNKVLKKKTSVVVEFAGEQKNVRFDYLIDRGDYIEAIRYKYKAPEYSIRARKESSKREFSEELLLLQRAGEKEARAMGIDPLGKNAGDKPVYGALYYLKHRNDTSQIFEPVFEDKMMNNIINFCFSKNEAAIVEARYQPLAADAEETDDERECFDCHYADLCKLEFEKRHLMEQPPIKLKTIDEIHLTDAQLAFVQFTNGECRVNAVAGSGKTTVVALRTLALIEEGADPSKILMVTFSEKAKEEMALRLKSFAQGQIMQGVELDIDQVQIETFNSWGQHMLDHYYSLLGFSSKPSLVDDVAKKDIIIELLNAHRDLPLDYRNPFLSKPNAEGAVVTMTKKIDSMKAAHVETEQDVIRLMEKSAERKFVDYAAELLEMYQAYNERLIQMNAIDYEDQLRLLLKLKDFGIFEKLDYEHIIIDEFQDSNPNQIDIVVELKRRNPRVKSLVVVGDELQAIYGFRDATPDNLVGFASYFPKMVDIDLTANFRSQQPIIQLANKIIARTSQLGKVIDAHKKSSNIQPAVLEIDNAETEIDLYVRQVKKLIRQGTPASSIAILCRTRSELIKLQMALDAEGVPTILKVPEIIGDAPYVKAVIAFASFLKDHDDRASLALFAKSLGQDPFEEKTLQESSEAILNVFDSCTTDAEKIDAFYSFLDDAYEDYVAASFIEKMKARHFQTFQQHLDYCTKYRDYNVKDTQSTSQEKTDCVTLITVHSSKGLEWDVVLLSLKKFAASGAEEQRLFYVGVTRAKEKLLLTYTPKQSMLARLIS